MGRCDRCSDNFSYPGVFALPLDEDGLPLWAAIFCSDECRDSFIDKMGYRLDAP